MQKASIKYLLSFSAVLYTFLECLSETFEAVEPDWNAEEFK